MKAIVCTQYGSPEVLELQNIEKPIPKEDDVLVKIYAASVTTADTIMRTGKPLFGRLFLGLTKPKYPITGTGFAGVIESIGIGVNKFKVGDKVFGESLFGFGTNAEYVCVPQCGVMVSKPESISFKEAAPICDGALTSINFLKCIANIKPGQKILINGASGSLGTAAVQLAKYFGAEVTGVCSYNNIEMVTELGADKVIDYHQQDFTKLEQTYDVIYDTVGTLSFSHCKLSLEKNGQFISPVLSFGLLIQVVWRSLFGDKKVKFAATGVKPTKELLLLVNELKPLFEKNKIQTVIDREYKIEDIIDAHNYIDNGHKKGNILITIV